MKKNYLRTGTDDEEVLKGNCLRSICEEGQEKGDTKYRDQRENRLDVSLKKYLRHNQ